MIANLESFWKMKVVPPIKDKCGILIGLIGRVPGSWAAGLMMAISTYFVYVPFLADFKTVYLHLDGPIYAYLAQSGYNAPLLNPFTAPPKYFASHLPLFPWLIRFVSFFTFGRYFLATILASVIASVCSAILFYHLLKKMKLVESPLWTILLFCFIPPRWLVCHAIGGTEPLFFCFVFSAFLAFYSNNMFLLVLSIIAASMTRITGVLLIPAFALVYLERRNWKNLALLSLGLIGIVATFTFYYFVYGDFWAYFRWNLQHQHFFRLQPFEVYLKYLHDPHGTELYLGSYVLYAYGTLLLFKRRELFYYSAIFFVFNCFVYHNDNSRYLLASAPFAILVAFDPVLTRRICRLALPLVLYLSYYYAWGLLPSNAAGEYVLKFIP